MRACFIYKLLIVFLMAAVPVSSGQTQAKPAPKLQVVTTLAVIAAIVKDIGGPWVEVASLSSAGEDPHFIKAKP
ncbi:MAG TPA: hypothetical protein VEL47_03680, partial [Myxococcota bacterium]|nr:hypothetical protein [Myxococcota bacterium]